jgi:hypothetical protein
MVADHKGLLAMDQSTTCNKRFAKWGIPQNEETRRAYRFPTYKTAITATVTITTVASVISSFGSIRFRFIEIFLHPTFSPRQFCSHESFWHKRLVKGQYQTLGFGKTDQN